MLKTGKVYLYENLTYYYIADRVKYSGRNTYTVRKVNANGTLGKSVKMLFKRGKFKLAKNVDVKVYVTLPKKDREKARFNDVIVLIKKYVKKRDKATAKVEKQYYAKKIAEAAWGACSFTKFEKDKVSKFTLRDVAKSVGFKSYQKLYSWVAYNLNTMYTPTKYQIQLPDASDATIVITLRNYQEQWNSYYGFNKKINELIEKDLMAYTQELNSRGLRL